MLVTAEIDIDGGGTEFLIAENIKLTAGRNINLEDATVRNDFGKPGEIVITAGGSVNITNATLVDDQKGSQPPDVSEINNREQLPHEGFNDIFGVPLLDD